LKERREEKMKQLMAVMMVACAVGVMVFGGPRSLAAGQQEKSRATERVVIKKINPPAHEPVTWHAVWTIEKRAGDWSGDDVRAGRAPAPYETYQGEDNLLMTAGANALWTALTGGSVTAFSNANAFIGVGDSTTTASASQTGLQASTNKVFVAMSAGYPSVATNAATFSASFGSSVGNFTWNEWCVANGNNPPSSGTMLDRMVQSMGTKASGSTWTFTVTVSLS
jgi:hypothetical protein